MPYVDQQVRREYHIRYQAALTDSVKAAERERKRLWALAHPEKRKASYQKKKAHYQAYERNRQYQKLYGITLADYDRMFLAQEGKCAVCGGPQQPNARGRVNFAVDHCHDTGMVRGLLCTACNVTIGRYERKRREIDAYLEKSK